MPRVVGRLVAQPDAPTTPAESERVVKLIGLLGSYSLMPALTGIVALLTRDNTRLRVRAPLVTLKLKELMALEKTIRDFGIDLKSA